MRIVRFQRNNRVISQIIFFLMSELSIVYNVINFYKLVRQSNRIVCRKARKLTRRISTFLASQSILINIQLSCGLTLLSYTQIIPSVSLRKERKLNKRRIITFLQMNCSYFASTPIRALSSLITLCT